MQAEYAEPMDRTSFDKEICECVKSHLSEEYHIERSHTKKNNGVLKDVLCIRKEEEECVPCFYMEELYQSYCMGEAILGLAEYMANIVKGECEKVKEQVKYFKCKDWIRENLFLRLIHLENNREILEESIYLEYMDLACVVYVVTEISEDGVKCFRLPKYMWESLELGEIATCFSMLIENTRRFFPEQLEYICYGLGQVGLLTAESSVFLENVREGEALIENRLYVLSNQKRINGATVILYPEMLETIGKRFGGGYYIIPSSIHEVLLLKANTWENAERLNEMVREVNRAVVIPEEVLSNHVYYYSLSEHKIEGR